jgi:putative copper export protein
MNAVGLWLLRWGHVVGGAIWVGGYALLALVIVPMLARNASKILSDLAIGAVRLLTYTGMATIFFGILLITRTRGFASLFRSEWGALVIASAICAIALLGLGDGALRPALRRIEATGDAQPAQRYAMLGFIVTLLAIGLMTRTLYAR